MVYWHLPMEMARINCKIRKCRWPQISRMAPQRSRSPATAVENHHFSWENLPFLWSFSIAMLNYQRVIAMNCHDTLKNFIFPNCQVIFSCFRSFRRVPWGSVCGGQGCAGQVPGDDAILGRCAGLGRASDTGMMGSCLMRMNMMGQ